MALPDIIRGTYISIMVGNDDGPPETFTPICGITTRNFTHQGNTTDVFTRDCADPEAIPVRRLVVGGEQWDLSGGGLLNRSQLQLVDSLMLITRNYRFVIGEPADDIVFGGYYAGPAMLTQKQISGGDEDMAGIELTIGSDGAWTWVDVP